MTKLGMTKRQTECLSFIKKYLGENGIPPSNDEIIVGLGLRARSGAVRLLRGLEDRGHIVRQKHKARSIALVPDPNEELIQLREIKGAAVEFLTRQKNWRETVAALGDNEEQAAQVSDAFNKLKREVFEDG
tara:strand:+ start:433 stop:825 length:393 start_codon:yes stop_codon:yes gene_type:complete